MNETPLNRTLPTRCEVLVIGAGPAGSACAQMLAQAGRDVLLVDRQVFPRDKVCGDGLIPDAHHALTRLGVHEQVMARARTADHVRCVGPRGGRIDVPGRLAVLPRRELDALLLDAAQGAGARVATPWRFEAPLLEGERIVGAQLSGAATAEVRADWTVLATGAAAQPLQRMGACVRQTPSAIALRGHVRHAAMDEGWRTLDVVWHRAFAGGYGWIFPGPDGVFNIGVGAAGAGQTHLRDLLARFAAVYEPAGRLLREGQWVAPAKGAPLRWSLTGAQPVQPGLLVAGEAVGSTYAFTGEGIGKALETGILAAEALAVGGGDAAVQRHYATALAAIKPRFDLYERAQRINRYPWLVDLLIWRANHTPALQRRMAGVLEETAHLGDPLSPRGLMRLMWPK